MKYIHVRWIHDHPDEPVGLYSELDDQGWEVRKVEVFRDGRIGFASRAGASDSTRLGLEPLPSLEDIARDPQFVPAAINREDFERVWGKACRQSVGASGA